MHLPYQVGSLKFDMLDKSLLARESILKSLQENLTKARNRMKLLADKKRLDSKYEVGDLVYIKLQLYRHKSVAFRENHKLAAKFFGPFEVEENVGKVAYKIKLPIDAKIHNTFHVSQLKRKMGHQDVSSVVLPNFAQSTKIVIREPKAILDQQLVKRFNKADVRMLVQWSNAPVEEATWEYYTDLQKKLPKILLTESLRARISLRGRD